MKILLFQEVSVKLTDQIEEAPKGVNDGDKIILFLKQERELWWVVVS